MRFPVCHLFHFLGICLLVIIVQNNLHSLNLYWVDGAKIMLFIDPRKFLIYLFHVSLFPQCLDDSRFAIFHLDFPQPQPEHRIFKEHAIFGGVDKFAITKSSHDA